MKKKLLKFKKLVLMWFYLFFNLKNKRAVKAVIKPKKNEGINVFFMPIFGFADLVQDFEKILGLVLHNNHAANIFYVGCDGYLDNCMWDSEKHLLSEKTNFTDRSRRKLKCFECSLNIKVNAAQIGADYISLKKISQTTSIANQLISTQNLSKISEHAETSSVRKCLVATTDDSYESKKIYSKFNAEGIKYYLFLKNFLSSNKIDRVVMVHGIYLEHGIIVDLCRELSIPVYVYGFGYRKKTACIVFGETYHKRLTYLEDSQWNVEITKNNKLELRDYIRSKVSGGRDMVNYHPNPVTEKSRILEILELNEKGTILFCTNVLWDASIYYSSELYSDLLSALFDVIEIASNSETNLIIRIHPAESKGGFSTKRPIVDEINKKYNKLPHNIKVISPESDISTYTLGDIADAVIIYGSNIGLEFAVDGKRVINIGKPYAYGKGFTLDVTSRNELVKYITNSKLIPPMTNSEIEKAERFAYFWFFKFMTEISEIDYNVLNATDSKLDLRSIKSNQSNNLRLIAEVINRGVDFDYQLFE
jgi:hypothetical protein